MIIDRNLEKYIVFIEDPIVRGLERMDIDKMRVVFVVSETGMLEGILPDADVRRWMIGKGGVVDLQTPILEVCNKDFAYCIDSNNSSIINEMSSLILGSYSFL